MLFPCSHIYPDKESLVSAALNMASTIAKMSPVAVMGTKHNLNYSRDHGVDEALNYIVRRHLIFLVNFHFWEQ